MSVIKYTANDFKKYLGTIYTTKNEGICCPFCGRNDKIILRVDDDSDTLSYSVIVNVDLAIENNKQNTSIVLDEGIVVINLICMNCSYVMNFRAQPFIDWMRNNE